MLTEQLGAAALGMYFVRLRAYAYARDLRLTDVARDIVARRLRLHPDPSRDGERVKHSPARQRERSLPRAPATNHAAFPERVNRNGRTTAVGNVR